ncbi:hypothetical protein GDO81_025703 [Engystomops pustulosus]|uniref:Uncharacterized protein n=1 Tax=Engystomops pustulosus TaxID=76066 RepID=A0AAV6YII7_ENGPU|nr:hypothetical protein GDO81_025703 [Engystomops pustulosus]
MAELTEITKVCRKSQSISLQHAAVDYKALGGPLPLNPFYFPMNLAHPQEEHIYSHAKQKKNKVCQLTQSVAPSRRPRNDG